MARAAEIAALRALGLSLAQVARVLGGNPQDLEPALAAHQERLEEQARQTSGAIEKIRKLRADLAQGHAPTAGELSVLSGSPGFGIAFDLPWPWGGERFELRDIQPLTYITGPWAAARHDWLGGSPKRFLALSSSGWCGWRRALRLARGSTPIRISSPGWTRYWLGSPRREPRSQIR
jgi:DNA-binding transcriptional MerR regulator